MKIHLLSKPALIYTTLTCPSVVLEPPCRGKKQISVQESTIINYLVGSMSASKKLHTYPYPYPSPNATLSLTCYQLIVVGLGRGRCKIVLTLTPLVLQATKPQLLLIPTACPISKLKHEPVSMSMTPYWYMQANTRSDKLLTSGWDTYMLSNFSA